MKAKIKSVNPNRIIDAIVACLDCVQYTELREEQHG